MKNQSPSNLWHPCPDGLISHVANRHEIEYRRKFLVNSSTTVILLFAAIFAVNDHFVSKTKQSESQVSDNPQPQTIACHRIPDRPPDNLDPKPFDGKQMVPIEKHRKNGLRRRQHLPEPASPSTLFWSFPHCLDSFCPGWRPESQLP